MIERGSILQREAPEEFDKQIFQEIRGKTFRRRNGIIGKEAESRKNAQELKVRQHGGRDREACCDR